MSFLDAWIKPKKIEVEAIITRADGTTENLGVIAVSYMYWFTPYWERFKQTVKRIFKGYFV